ncbi:uncharacterized protein BCR38DRAFT_487174 [Pseudomassariella vexata]|uniref:LysM domain-containing protein n=1 Tax=Pseudomassariella vexata TaxID=1141098 RepID=A0A1Y2DQ52_9PEZI|nr:uncharacterized protein BCR38DRAFT_487174 [Pseudomassariella vexata]ORY61421.1 hypothetical protein BCR38DRAFT_487174 [Pseudomassariella vexata]
MAFQLRYLLTSCLLIRASLASFNLYPGVSPEKLALSLNITSACVQALNQTISECDQTLLQMTQSLENYWWTDDNLTAICTPNDTTTLTCADAVSEWNGNAAAACDEQYFAAYGQLVPIWTVTERFVDSTSFACLESWSDNFTWCLTESQEWVGADVLRADCDVDPTDPTCSGNVTSIPEESIRLANFYEDDILCNNCFINQLYARVTSQFLPNSDHSDYLVDQLYDVQDVCNITLPDFTIRLPYWYDTAPPLTSLNLGSSTTATATATSSASSTTTTCFGQLVGGSSSTKAKKSWAEVFSPGNAKVEARQDAATCDDLSLQYGVSTGALQWFSDSDTCDVSSGICLPAACNLQQVVDGDTCASLAASVRGDNSTTLVQFMKWNPYVLGLCDSLTAGQYVCISSPGTNGTFTLPDPPLGTDADAGNQQRGGAGGVVTPTTTITTTANSVSGGSAPSPTQDGLVSNCNNYASATVGEGCYDFATSHNIEPTQLYAWNPVLGLNGIDCTTALWASEYYCIGTQKSTATTPITAPGPTQSGIVSNCNKYAAAIASDGCDVFAARNEITNAELYTWNPILGVNGENCLSSLWADEYYCVGVAPLVSGSVTTTTSLVSSSKTTATSTTSVTAPGPTQTGIVASCNKFAEATGGIGCYDFAVANGITTAQLYAWNAVLGDNGENCGTLFWAEEYYCIGVSS